MCAPTRRRRAWQGASSTPPSVPSRSWRSTWLWPPGPPASPSAPSSPTASTASTPRSSASCGRLTSPTCWRSSPPRSSGPRLPSPSRPPEAADRLRWGEPNDADHPGAWTAVVRRFHDGHEEPWWAVDLRLGSYAPEYPTRLVVATSDPRTLPAASTWYLVTNLPVPGTTRAAAHPGLPPADLEEVVRLYGLRQWVEQGYKQVKQELGWADFQVRSDRAIRRHWALVCCAFAFCWWAAKSPLPQEPGAGEKWGPGAAGDLVGRARQRLAAAVHS